MNPLLLGNVAKEVAGGLDSLFTSDEERMEGKAKIEAIMQQPHVLQAMANIEEAKHKSMYVAGWRPAIGWICAIGIGYQFILLPIVGMVLAIFSPEAVLPVLQVEAMMTLVLSLLGLGGMRSYEKRHDKASDSMTEKVEWDDDGGD